MHDAARRDFYAKMDVANVDLKAFSEALYFKLTGAHLQPVLDSLRYLKHETDVWFEITTLLIPGENDSDEELTAMCQWIGRELGPEVPLHFSAFHPDYKMTDILATPLPTLMHARQIAQHEGLRHVYTGNVHNQMGDTTICPGCQTPLVVRDCYNIDRYLLTGKGHCPVCDAAIAGRFDKGAGGFGRKRIPIAIREYT